MPEQEKFGETRRISLMRAILPRSVRRKYVFTMSRSSSSVLSPRSAALKAKFSASSVLPLP